VRVIAGEARGRPLKGPPKGPRGSGTRPTSDKVKGAIFSMLEAIMVSGVGPPGDCSDKLELPPIEGQEEDDQSGEEAAVEATEPGIWAGKRVSDLYAGTGALGIEALSRGAAHVDFVDASPVCQRLIRDNLRGTGLAERGRVIGGSLPAMLERSGDLGPFDLALLDPPYGDPSLERTLAALEGRDLLASEALVVVEHSRRGEPAADLGRLRLIRRRRHGDTEISIYRREG
jgi:16S rRNA (guanine966-N2)-methyltransferase